MATPGRSGSIKKPTPRVSNVGGRGLLGKPPLTPPSFLNGSGESVSVVNTSLLNLPSPPNSRNSSAQGSYATSATTFEDIGDDEVRGRGESSSADRSSIHKDGKGNVLVSVRIRPDAGTKDAKQDLEWNINGKRSMIAYKGKEGGEYIYGIVAQHDAWIRTAADMRRSR